MRDPIENVSLLQKQLNDLQLENQLLKNILDRSSIPYVQELYERVKAYADHVFLLSSHCAEEGPASLSLPQSPSEIAYRCGGHTGKQKQTLSFFAFALLSPFLLK